MSPGCNAAANLLSICNEPFARHGPSRTLGAVMPVRRSGPVEVEVFQWPCWVGDQHGSCHGSAHRPQRERCEPDLRHRSLAGIATLSVVHIIEVGLNIPVVLFLNEDNVAQKSLK